MVFYWKLCPETMCSFDIVEEGILHWRKSVVLEVSTDHHQKEVPEEAMEENQSEGADLIPETSLLLKMELSPQLVPTFPI